MRGQPFITLVKYPADRITPALAGTTSGYTNQKGATQDHPRACGDNVMTLNYRPLVTGSPPRLRGQPTRLVLDQGYAGITPALAGTTKGNGFDFSVEGDHPRACGDNFISFISESGTPGSPPRLRGQPELPIASDSGPRITPALAGTTPIPRSAYPQY